MSDEQKSSILRQLSTEQRNQLLVFAENCYDRESEVCDEKARDVLFNYVETILAQASLDEAIVWSAMALNMSSEGFRVWCKSRIATLQAASKGEGTSPRP